VKLAAFEHHRPSSVAEAVHLLGSLPDAKVLAGGQSLIPVMALRMGTPAHLVDLGRIDELQTIDDDGGWLTIGAGVRQSTLERFPDLATRVPLLSASLPNIGHRAIRNRGTVCGSLAHADPAAELPAAAVVLGAELVIVGPAGRRTVTADSFFLGYLSTAIGGDELLVQVRFPIAAAGQGAAVAEASRRHGDFAIVGAAATVELESSRVSAAAVGLFGVAGAPIRLPAVEEAVVGVDPTAGDAWDRAGELARSSAEPTADDHGSTAYKQQLMATMTRRALRDAAARAAEANR
jgi:aerobic carbon-monoxide dehydrogenase medium subunit